MQKKLEEALRLIDSGDPDHRITAGGLLCDMVRDREPEWEEAQAILLEEFNTWVDPPAPPA